MNLGDLAFVPFLLFVAGFALLCDYSPRFRARRARHAIHCSDEAVSAVVRCCTATPTMRAAYRGAVAEALRVELPRLRAAHRAAVPHLPSSWICPHPSDGQIQGQPLAGGGPTLTPPGSAPARGLTVRTLG